MSAKVISFINSKGGVAKTTSAVNIATQLRIKRKKVLLVDLDPQGDASYMLGLNSEGVAEAHIGHALMKPEVFAKTIYTVDFIKKTGNKKSTRDISVCPAHAELDDVVNHLMNQIARELRLQQCLEQVKDDYDYIILDCPPNLGVSSINALVASDFYVLVVDSEPLAMKNIIPNSNAVAQVQASLNANLKLLGVLFTKYDQQTGLHKQVVEVITETFGNNVFKNKIPRNIEIAEAAGKPLCEHAPRSKGNLAYTAAAEELIKRVKQHA
ncbi:MAG: ParA family protein [Lentisphaeraceae bacterium]|nr:ParA family protein [Lentisphaeraceae bacterium]